MRSLGVVALVLVCVALFAYAVKNVLSKSDEWGRWELDTTRLFTAIEVERLIQDSTQPWKDSLAKSIQVSRNATLRHRQRGDSLKGVSDSLWQVLRGAPNAPESLHVALQAIETLEGSLGEARRESEALEAIIASQSQMLGVAKLENDRLWTLLDSASSVIRRVPQACKVPLTGIPCPKPVLGVGLTADGVRVFAGIGIGL